MTESAEPQGSGRGDMVRLTLIVGTKDWVGAAPSRVWVEQFELDEATALGAEKILDDILHEHLVDGGVVPHALDGRKGHTSSGADSGSFAEIALFIGGALAEHVLGKLFDGGFSRLRSRVVRDQPEPWHEPMDRNRAVEVARWHLDAAYRLAREAVDSTPGPDDQLEVIEELHDRENDHWTITFRHIDGTEYRVALSSVAGIPSPASIERRALKD